MEVRSNAELNDGPAAAAAAAAAAGGDGGVSTEGFCTLRDVYLHVADLLVEDRTCPCTVLDMVRESRNHYIKEHAATDKVQMAKSITDVAVLTLELLACVCIRKILALQGMWERIAFAAVSLAAYWVPGVFRQEPCRNMTAEVKLWVLFVMNFDIMCCKPLLRLELLRFAAMWDARDLVNPHLGFYMTYGLLRNVPDLSVSRLLPTDRPGLLCVLRKLLYNLHAVGYLGPLMEEGCEHIQRLQVWKEERVFAYLVVLMAKAAERLRRMCCSKVKTMRSTIVEFADVLHILRLLTATSPNQRLYEMPGMCQLAGGAVATTFRCIVLTSVEPRAEDHFAMLLGAVDDYFRCLMTHPSGALLDDLRRHHGHILALVSRRMRQHGCPPRHVPQPMARPRLCPVKKFLDSMTNRLMTRPVRLEATGDVVDYTTLLRLMLTNEADPDTGRPRPRQDFTYMPLRDLQDEICAWREAARGRGSDCDGDAVQGDQRLEDDQDEDEDRE